MLERKLEAIKSADLSEILDGTYEGQPMLKIVFELYKHHFGEVCSFCPHKINAYIHRLKKLNSRKMEKSKYRLMPGRTCRHSNGETFSEHNLTDEIAAELLRENPNRITLFSKFPEDWASEEEASELEEFTFKELKEMYPEIKAKSKKAFIKAIEEIENEEQANTGA